MNPKFWAIKAYPLSHILSKFETPILLFPKLWIHYQVSQQQKFPLKPS